MPGNITLVLQWALQHRCGYLTTSSNHQQVWQQTSLGPCKIASSTVLHAVLFVTKQRSASAAVLHFTANSSSRGR